MSTLSLHPNDVGPALDYSKQSNLAFALRGLPRQKREDMNVFYTYCRVIDDIADEPHWDKPAKETQLSAWLAAIDHAPQRQNPNELRLIDQLHDLIARYPLPTQHLKEIVKGCQMDLWKREYDTFEELREYCYYVASAVGLVSIEIFGYPKVYQSHCQQYAIQLGLALQMTNIIRDVGCDLRNDGRVYLPKEDLEHCGYSLEKLKNDYQRATHAPGQFVYPEAFVKLMEFESARALAYYKNAKQLLAQLPRSARPSFAAAEMMGDVYSQLLRMIRKDHFQVLTKSYKLSKARKIGIVLQNLVRQYRSS